ncbi:MAG TPA: peroxiredoxin [Solirubrobacteraceae bacterium]|jgi:peroxiredoxin Q/BCP|nr:peroxiredoxin [Solirubrobacteraceae bacterium]
MAGPHVGDLAPDFALEGTEGPFRLSDHRGERVVLLFYPGDDTPGCTRQFCSYRDRADELARLGATIVGISGKGLDSKRAWIAKHGLRGVPLLADVDREVAALYGVRHRLLGTKRSVFVIDEQGVIRHRDVKPVGMTFEDVDALRAALAF